MAGGGFLVKFDEKEPQRGYAVSFDYDEWSYAINNEEKKEIPKGIQKITIEVASVPRVSAHPSTGSLRAYGPKGPEAG